MNIFEKNDRKSTIYETITYTIYEYEYKLSKVFHHNILKCVTNIKPEA